MYLCNRKYNKMENNKQDILDELNHLSKGVCKWDFLYGYEDRFIISTKGDVFSLTTKKLMKLQRLPNGYMYLPIMMQLPKRHTITAYIHRLVAQTFIPNPYNKETVNHIEGDKSNNDISNLEWCTQSEQNYHACRVLKHKRNTDKILQYNKRRRLLTWEEVEYIRKYHLKAKAIKEIFNKDISNSIKLQDLFTYKVYKNE